MFLKASDGIFVYNNEQSNQNVVNYAAQVLPDTSLVPDSLSQAELLADDSITLNGNNLWYDLSPDALDEMINYKGVDSIVYDLDSGKTYIYAKGEITYQTFFLKADFIEFDWDAKTICAKLIVDSTR